MTPTRRRGLGLLAVGVLVATACSEATPRPEAGPASGSSPAPSASVSTPHPTSSSTAENDPAPLAWGSARVEFASVDAARAVLGERDGFVQTMSAFDRSLRLQTQGNVDEKAYLEHAAKQVLPWPAGAREKWRSAGVMLQKALVGLELPVPARVLIVITTGREEMAVPYTRGNAIVIPQKIVDSAASPLALLAHELLHVSTRHQPALRDRLYPILGFRRTSPVPFPAELEARRLTNPDAHDNRHAILVESGTKKLLVAPILFSKLGPAEAAGVPLEKLFELRLVELTSSGVAATKGKAGTLVVHPVEATDFLKLAGVNTGYAIHPEEVLADNFERLIERRAGIKVDVPRPEILEALERALSPRK